jgi:hypothetical protein
MAFLKVQQLLQIFLLINVVFAGRFSFAIQEIDVGEPLGSRSDGDKLVLAMVSTTGYGVLNKTWSLGPVKRNSTIKRTDLIHEVEVPATASNLSIAIGVLNNPNDGDNSTSSK